MMSLLLVFGSTSKEYLHLFADHQDTVHVHSDHDGLSFESEHHHCTFLSFTLTPFAHDAVTYRIQEAKESFLLHQSVAVVHLVPRSVPSSRLRGPPVA